MPFVINKKTRKRYPVTEQELQVIKKNLLVRNAFEYIETTEPDEVKALKKKIAAGDIKK